MRSWVCSNGLSKPRAARDCLTDHVSLVTDVKVRANVATELRDSIEPLCSGASYPIFLAKLWPVFKSILKGEPVFLSMSNEQVRDLAGDFPGS